MAIAARFQPCLALYRWPTTPDETLAIDAGLMRPVTARAVLSLGDRMCLAIAKRPDGVALTADRPWADFAKMLDVRVELIR